MPCIGIPLAAALAAVNAAADATPARAEETRGVGVKEEDDADATLIKRVTGETHAGET